MLQSYSNQNSMELAQKQTYGSMEQNLKKNKNNKPTHLWSVNLQQKKPEYTIGKRICILTGIGKVGQLHVNQ